MPMVPVNKKDVFYVEFKTNEMPGKLVATQVILRKEILKANDDKLQINLCDHPLYELLEQYVHGNPSQSRREKR